MPPLNLLLVLLPVLTALLSLAVFGWQRHQRQQRAVQLAAQQDKHERQVRLEQERQRRTEILATETKMRQDYDLRHRGTGAGELAMAFVGTAAAGIMPELMYRVVAAGAESFLANPFLVEPDDMSRTDTVSLLPDAVARRTVQCELDLLHGGLMGASVAEAEAIHELWIEDLRRYTVRWLAEIRRQHVVSFVIVLSSGGSATLVKYLIRAIKKEHPHKDVCVVLIVDEQSDKRAINLPQLIDHYARTGMVRGTIALDNRSDSTIFDAALAQVIPAIITSPWLAERGKSGFNTLHELFRCHNLATLRTWQVMLPVTYHPSVDDVVPELWTTPFSNTRLQAITGVKEILGNPALQSIPLPAAEKQFVYVTGAIEPDFLSRIAASVARSEIPGLSWDTQVGFASIGTHLTPETTEAPLTVISMVPLPSGLDGLKQYADETAHRAHDHDAAALALAPLRLQNAPTNSNGQETNHDHLAAQRSLGHKRKP